MSGDLAPIRGTWTLVSAIRDGQPLGADFVSSGQRELAGDVTTVRFRGQVFMQGTTSVDSSSRPMTIDYRLTSPPGRGKLQLGLYEFEGELLRVIVAQPGRPRPADFSTVLGDDRTLTVWRRAES